MICYIQINSTNKAKNDIDRLMRDALYKDLAIKGIGSGKVETFCRKLFSVANLLIKLKRNDVLIIQYPFKKFYTTYCRIAKLKHARTITLIHDLGTFRRKKLSAKEEISRLNRSDYIIAHNEKMKMWLTENGCKCRIGCLKIFDYLSDYQNQNEDHHRPYNRIAYAGGLYKRKNAFLYDAGKAIEGCVLDLYGKGDLDTNLMGENIKVHGRIDPDSFIENVDDDWGLIWDGDTMNGCNGTWGNYLRYNNPHKTSFYLRAGLPVIVWKESAMAPFILEHNIGIAVDSLNEIPSVIKDLTEDEYTQKLDNTQRIKTQLQEGAYLYKALKDAMHTLNS